MAKKSNFLKNLLTTASAMAVITAGASSAYAVDGDLFARPAGNAARFGNVGLDFHNSFAGHVAAAFVDNNNYINSRVDAPATGVAALTMDTAAVNINSFNMYGNGNATLTIAITAGSLGSVYDNVALGAAGAVAQNTQVGGNGGLLANPAPGVQANSRLKVVLGGAGNAFTTKLTGTGGVVNAFTIPLDSYDSLGEIDFGAGANVLRVLAGSGNAITLNNATANNTLHANSQLFAETSLTVKDASFAKISKFKIANNKNLTFDVGVHDIETTVNSRYTFVGDDAELGFVVNAAGGKKIKLGASLIDAANGDDRGKVTITNSAAAGAANLLTVGALVPGTATTLGGANDGLHRLRELNFAGTGDILVDADVTATSKLIDQGGTGKATITNAVNMAAGSDITFAAAGKLEFLDNVTSAAAHVTNGGELILSANKVNTITLTTVTDGKLTADAAALTGALTVNGNGIPVGNTASASVASVTGDVIVRDAIVSIAGTAGGIIDALGTGGIVNLTGDGNVVGPIGGTAQVGKISVSGNRTFTHAQFGAVANNGATELNFADNDKKVTLVDAGASLLATNVTLDAGVVGSVIEVKQGPANVQAVAGAINADGRKNAAGDFALTIKMVENAASAVNVTTANFKTNLTSTFDNKITLNLNAGSIGEVGNLGSQGAKFVVTNFDQAAGAEVSVGNIYSDIINIRAGKVAKFRGEVVGTQTNLVDAASKARFADGATLDSAFVGAVGGLVEFEGGAFINKAIRGVGSVKFLAAAPAGAGLPKQAALRAGIGATTIEAGDTQLFALENVRMDGATTAKHVGADSGKNARFTDLKLTGDVSVSSTLKKLGGDVKTGTVIVENNPLNLQNVQSTIVVIDDTGSGAPVEGKEYQILRTESGVVGSFDSKLDVINLRDGSSALYAARTDNLGNIYLTQKNNTKNKIEDVIAVAGLTSADSTNLKALSADEFIADELADMNLLASKAELAQRLVASEVKDVLGDLTTRIGADLGSRMGTLAGLQGSPVQTKVVSNGTTGLSAGDDVNRYGAWISPFFNKSTQKSRKEAAGYTATTGGGSFGFDTKANDDMIVGLALSMLHTDVKHKNFKSGDKTKVDSVMFSVYGMQQITDNWFAQGLVTAGSSKVSTNENRKVSDTAYQKASGKYTSMSFSGEALLGYNYVMDQVSITPMGGVRLTRVNDEGYKETGTTNQNLNVSRKALNRAELVLGARVAGGTFDLNGLSVTPEIHGFLNQDVIGKASKVDMTTKGGTKLADKSSKPNKTMFNVGVGLNATYNSMEYGAGYDAHLANKFVGHQGTLKVRVNF
jgi:outer membrane autotransporter protein